jgi:hypothetical protein
MPGETMGVGEMSSAIVMELIRSIFADEDESASVSATGETKGGISGARNPCSQEWAAFGMEGKPSTETLLVTGLTDRR